MEMPTTLIHKYHTLKTKKSTKRLSSKDIFPTSSPSPSPSSSSAPQPYTSFIGDLVSAFNSLSTPSASSTTSPTLHTYFQGVDHEALVDTAQKKKVVKALQLANPAQVNEIISLLKAMPDPTKAAVGVTAGKKAHSREGSQQSVLSLLAQDKTNTKPRDTTETAKKQKRNDNKEPTTKQRMDEDEKLGEDWDKVEKKWGWETQKSNDQLTGVVDPESCKGSIISTAGSWIFSSAPTAAPAPAPAPAAKPAKVEAPPKTAKPKPAKISTSATTNDATKSTGFGSLFTSTPTTASATKSKPPPNTSSLHNKNKKLAASNKRTVSSTSLSTGEQIANAAATLLATAAISSPKELSPTTTTNAQKQVQRQSSMPNIKTATLKRLLTTTKASTPDPSTLSKAKSSSSSTDLTTSSIPSYISTTITSLTRQWLTLQSSPPPTHMMSVYTYWWGYEIYVPHKCMDNIERVSNTSQIFFGFLCTAISAIPGLAALVPIAKIISAWVGYQWAVIKTQDTGKGVVISATWVLPVALASRHWDHCGTEDDHFPAESSLLPSPKKTLKSKLSFIRA
ncbi:hypothetical protein BGZ96_008079 [Linnemannia gamsii]|uniref:Uncharacterized protein n=1 Tax=Linnemannia gamsii TaxID=64522 RepID=A0ABQ7JZI8_9FUNG|nr:hypothetical protein BGZ96_008079 [Linnemannia gamsii]